MANKLSVVGKSVPRIDAYDKVTGRAKYGIDLQMDGMLYAKILRSPYPHAKIVTIDIGKAEHQPGVKAVVTINETPKVAGGIGKLMTEEKTKSLYILDDVVRFIGDPIAAVAADTEQLAEEALASIKVEYEQLPAVFDPLDAMQENAPKIHPNGNIALHLKKIFPSSDDDSIVKEAFRKADYIFENKFITSKNKHCATEPFSSCIADYDLNGFLTVYSSSQRPHVIKTYLAGALGLSANKVRIIKPHTGGAFGGRDYLIHGLEVMCSFLSRKTGRPVKMTFTREEDFETTESGHPFIYELKIAVTKNGILTGMTVKAIMDVGAYGPHIAGVLGVAMTASAAPYRCPVLFDGYAVYTNKVSSGAIRGYGHHQINFALESQMDIIADKLRIDPVELRLRNHRGLGEIDPIINQPIRSDGMQDCLEKGAEKSGWSRRKEKNSTEGQKKRGLGMSCIQMRTGSGFHIPDIASAVVMLNTDGSANLITGAAEDGAGTKTILAQVAAEELAELGIGFDRIAVSETNTEVTPYDVGTIAQRQPYCGGIAVKKAAAEAKNALLEFAAQELDVDRDRLRIKESIIYDVKDPDKKASVSDLLRKFQFQDMHNMKQIIGFSTGAAPSSPLTYGANFAEVEVDTETGQVRIIKLTCALDVGKAINPALVEGQITGGQVWGIGYALTEGLIVRNGKVLNNNFKDYRVLRACDIPEIEAIIVENNEPTGAFGAKGAGQAVNIGAASAISNAIYNATGVRIKELPITQEEILAALHSKEKPG